MYGSRTWRKPPARMFLSADEKKRERKARSIIDQARRLIVEYTRLPTSNGRHFRPKQEREQFNPSSRARRINKRESLDRAYRMSWILRVSFATSFFNSNRSSLYIFLNSLF